MRPRVIVTALVLAASIAWPAAAQKRYRAERFDVELALQPDGSMSVTEQVRFRFDGGPFTRVFRRLSRHRTDGISAIRGEVDGAAWPPAGGGGRFEIERENGVQVTWRFPATEGRTRALGLGYRAAGVIERRPDADLFVWETLPLEHDYEIDAATVRLRWPAGGRLVEAPSVWPAGATVEATGDAVVVRLDHVPRNGGLRLAARFASGSITSATPRWQARGETGRRLRPTMVAAAGAILLAGFAGLLVVLNGLRREPVGADRHARSPEPPSDLPVAVAASASSPGVMPTALHCLGALLGLACRGAIRIAERGERTWRRQRAFEVTLVERPASLASHERVLLDILFQRKGEARGSLTLSEAARAVRYRWRRWQKALIGDLDSLGLLSPERRRSRRVMLGAGILVTSLAFVAFLALAVLADRFSGWPMLVPGAFGLVGLGILIAGASLSPLSEAGRHQAAQWRSFFRYLKDVTRERSSPPDRSVFERYLPFAVSQGLGPQWLKAFRRSGGLVAIPAWFAAGASADAARQMDAFVAMIAVTHSAGHAGAGGGVSATAGGGGASGAN